MSGPWAFEIRARTQIRGSVRTSMNSITVKLHRAENYVEDVRTPVLLKLSRVPCVGELVSITHATQGGQDTSIGGIYKVTGVLHLSDSRVQAQLSIVEIDE